MSSPARSDVARYWGTVHSTDGASVRLSGLAKIAQLGDRVEIAALSTRLPGEIVALDDTLLTVLLEGSAQGIATGQRAWLLPNRQPSPNLGWLGNVVDSFGRLADGRVPGGGSESRKSKIDRPNADLRRPLGPRLTTGLAALDTFLPLCRGQRLGVFAGSGVGKSRLMADLALGVSADVVVIGLIGERSREVGDFVRLLEQNGGMGRTVVIAATSDQPALSKRRAAELTLATAEYFRDEGAHVLCLLDSVTRFAEAHREIALAAGEPPALRAYPPSTTPMIASLCERAGPGYAGDMGGDITAVFTVLVAGSDMDEPVADMVRGVLDGHVILDRAIAERGRFPAIDLRRSVSRSAPAAWTDEETALVTKSRQLIAAREEAAPMLQAGLYAPGSDAVLDEAVRLWPALDQFIGTVTRGETDVENFAKLAEILASAPELA